MNFEDVSIFLLCIYWQSISLSHTFFQARGVLPGNPKGVSGHALKENVLFFEPQMEVLRKVLRPGSELKDYFLVDIGKCWGFNPG